LTNRKTAKDLRIRKRRTSLEGRDYDLERKTTIMTPTSDEPPSEDKFKRIPDDLRYEFKQKLYH